jgi:hypothetical protein
MLAQIAILAVAALACVAAVTFIVYRILSTINSNIIKCKTEVG